MVPDFNENEQADIETDRVVSFITRVTVAFLACAFVIVVARCFVGCKPPVPPPQDAGKCTVVVVTGVDAGTHDADWGY